MDLLFSEIQDLLKEDPNNQELINALNKTRKNYDYFSKKIL